MPNASIGGLASGLDTATIIDQLMQLEAVSQNRLKTQVSTNERKVSSMTTLNAKVASLTTLSSALADPTAWSPLTARSSYDKATVTAGKDASPGTFTATVTQVATSHQLGFADAAATTDVVVGGGSTAVRLDRLDGTTLDVETGDGTLQGLVDALNDPANETGVQATAIRVGEGAYKLLLTSTTTGATSDFALTNTDGSDLLGGATVRAGQDAKLDLGAGVVAASATNTFTDLVEGVDVTLAAGAASGTSIDITISRDSTTLSSKVKALVDQVNSATTEMDSLTAYGLEGSTAGLLAGDTTVRSLRSSFVDALYGPDGLSMADLGIQVDRQGKLVFDAATFKAAYEADPAAVAARFDKGAGGFAERVRVAADRASNKDDGLLTQAITGRRASIQRLNDSIEQWDTRLELRRNALTRQFTALETALSQMNSQSSWLAGQINSLSSSSGS